MKQNSILILGILILNGFSHAQEDFRIFLLQFFSSKEFQINRIEFPLEFVHYITEGEREFVEDTTFIEKSNWHVIQDSSFLTSDYHTIIYDNFDATFRDTGQRVFRYEGNENGINEALYFVLRDGKWYLIRKADLST